VIERGRRSGFLFESLKALWIRGEASRQDFDRHVATEARIVSAIHFTHAASSNCAGDFVGTKARTTRQHG
jgi:hypothetical protein